MARGRVPHSQRSINALVAPSANYPPLKRLVNGALCFILKL